MDIRRTMDRLSLFTELDGWSDPEARNEIRRDIADHHLSRGVWDLDKNDDYEDLILKFLAARPDGIAFNAEGRDCVFLNSYAQWTHGKALPMSPQTGPKEKTSRKI